MGLDSLCPISTLIHLVLLVRERDIYGATYTSIQTCIICDQPSSLMEDADYQA